MTEQTQNRYRLAPDEYKRLAQKLPPPVVTGETTAHQAGYFLGIQHVLKVLREGWVNGD